MLSYSTRTYALEKKIHKNNPIAVNRIIDILHISLHININLCIYGEQLSLGVFLEITFLCFEFPQSASIQHWPQSKENFSF